MLSASLKLSSYKGLFNSCHVKQNTKPRDIISGHIPPKSLEIHSPSFFLNPSPYCFNSVCFWLTQFRGSTRNNIGHPAHITTCQADIRGHQAPHHHPPHRFSNFFKSLSFRSSVTPPKSKETPKTGGVSVCLCHNK